MFLRDTLYGEEWFPPIDSFPLRVRDPFLATGAGRHVYLAGRAGVNGDSLDGGLSWSGPQVLAGLPEVDEPFPDLKSWRKAGGNEVSIAYVNSYQFHNTIYWRKATADDPTEWSAPVRMNRLEAAVDRNRRPKLCYLAGVSPVTAGVVYCAADGTGVYWGSPHGGGVEQRPTVSSWEPLQVSPSVGRGSFRVSGASGLELVVRDRSGRLVRGMAIDAAGRSTWDGRDAGGGRVAAGVYFIESDVRRQTASVVVMRWSRGDGAFSLSGYGSRSRARNWRASSWSTATALTKRLNPDWRRQ